MQYPKLAGIASLLGLILLAACGVPEDEHLDALATIDSLRSVVDELEHGAPRLLATIRQRLSSDDHRAVIAMAADLIERHPDSDEAAEAEQLRDESQARLASVADSMRRAADQERAAAERERARALAGLYKREDRVENRTVYFDRSSSQYVNSSSRVILYITHRAGGDPFLFFRVNYKADDWLFVEGFTFNIDGRNFRIDPSYGEMERDNGSGDIWEWYTTVAGSTELSIVRAIVESSSAVLRYSGRQYYRDRTIGNTEKQALRKVLAAYEALGGSF